MQILKPLLRIFIAVLVLGAISLGVLFHLSKRTPSRYNPTALSTQQIEEAATRVDTQKMPALLSYANRAHALASRSAQSRTTAPSQPPLVVTFTQDEINSSFIKWSQRNKDVIDRYVTQPYVVIENGQVIVMGTVPELSRVVSMYLEPKIDDKGQLRCDASSVYLGSLPLPDALFNKYREKLEGALKARMPQWQRGAKIDGGGSANSDARAVLLSRLVIQMLKREPGPALLFVPKKPEDWSNTVPLRLTELAIEKGEVTITIQPIDAKERGALLEQIRQPIQNAASDASPQVQ